MGAPAAMLTYIVYMGHCMRVILDMLRLQTPVNRQGPCSAVLTSESYKVEWSKE